MELKSDFWKFYFANKSFIDDIIRAQVYRYRFNYDTDDLSQEVLVYLHKRKVLDQYDSKQSSLNTFITNRIKGYLLHITQKIDNDETHLVDPSGEEDTDKWTPRTRVYYKDINGLPEWVESVKNSCNDGDYYDTGIPEQGSMSQEDRLIFKEKIAQLKAHLTPKQWIAFVRLQEGCTHDQIAEETHTSATWISSNYKPMIKQKLRIVFGVKGKK